MKANTILSHSCCVNESARRKYFFHHCTNNGTQAEWPVDCANQSCHLYINGEEVIGISKTN